MACWASLQGSGDTNGARSTGDVDILDSDVELVDDAPRTKVPSMPSDCGERCGASYTAAGRSLTGTAMWKTTPPITFQSRLLRQCAHRSHLTRAHCGTRMGQ